MFFERRNGKLRIWLFKNYDNLDKCKPRMWIVSMVSSPRTVEVYECFLLKMAMTSSIDQRPIEFHLLLNWLILANIQIRLWASFVHDLLRKRGTHRYRKTNTKSFSCLMIKKKREIERELEREREREKERERERVWRTMSHSLSISSRCISVP